MCVFLRKYILFFISIICLHSVAWSQQETTVSGIIYDEAGRPLSYVTVGFLGTTVGRNTDDDGKFEITTTRDVKFIVVQTLGYKTDTIAIKPGKKQVVNVRLKNDTKVISDFVFKYDGNPAEKLIDSVRAHRDKNDMKRRDSYQAEAYVKTQFNVYNLSEKFIKRKIFKTFNEIFENADTINGVPHYPFLFSETLSDVYKKKNQDFKEVVKALQMSGIENQNFGQVLGSVYNDFNIYSDNQVVFTRSFVGPISPIGKAYYYYELTDSAYREDKFCYKVEFKPKLSNELSYIGHLWIDKESFAIKEVELQMNKKANINLIADFQVKEVFNTTENGDWVMISEEARMDVDPKDFIDFSMNLAPKSEKFRLSILKTSSFKDYVFDQPPGPQFPKFSSNITIDAEAKKDSVYWVEHRHDTLKAQEKQIYQTVETIKQKPLFKFFYKVGDLIGSGYVNLDYFAIGPIYEVWSMNPVEGHRIKLGGRTGDKVSKRFYFEGHGMYGTRDHRWKWDSQFYFHINKKKNPWRLLSVRARMDIEQVGISQGQWRPDNVLASFLSRRPFTALTYLNEGMIKYQHDWFTGFNQTLTLNWRQLVDAGPRTSVHFIPFDPVTGQQMAALNKITTAEIMLETTFAYGQRDMQGRVKRVAIPGRYPIVNLTYKAGIKGIFGSEYNYHYLSLSLYNRVQVKPLGMLYYNLTVGKIFGTAPYPLLYVHRGNNSFIFEDKVSFNLMNYFEFVSDQWVSVSLHHHFDGFFFNKIPGLRKTKIREAIGINMAWGKISDHNKRIMALPETTYELRDQLTGKYIPYIEINAGLENIFNIFRIHFVYRVTHRNQPDPNNPGFDLYPNAQNWAIMGGIDFKL